MAWLDDILTGGGAAVGTAILPGAGTAVGGAVGSFLGDIGGAIGGLFGGGDSVDVSSIAVRYAVEHATRAEREWLAEALGSGWRGLYNIHALSDAAVEQIALLTGGGLNQRYNSDEKRIRDRTLTLLQRYPYGSVPATGTGSLTPAPPTDQTYQWGGAPAVEVTAPPPPTYTDSGGSNWWEAISGGISYDSEGGFQVGAQIDNRAQQITTMLYAAGGIIAVLLVIMLLRDR